MLTPNPLSLLCAILLCFPLALIFTFTTPSSSSSRPPPLPVNATDHSRNLPVPQHSEPASLIKSPTTHRANTTNTILALRPNQLLVEDEEDDKLLFERASRVDPNPKSPKKLAFMFLTTTPLPFASLWELYFARAPKRFYNIYVHADPTGNYTSPGFRGVFRRRLIPSKPTRRHTPTLIAAARRLLAHALLHDESNSMFALLSPSCIPIHSFAYTYKTLARSRRSFIEILENEPGAYDRWAARGEEAMVPEVEYKDFRIGSQFWVVKRKHAWMIVGERRVWSKFKLPCLQDDTCYPEEQYFPTVLSMVDRRGCIPCTLTHVDWRESHGGHPRTYEAHEVGPDLIWSLRKKRPRYGDDYYQNEGRPSNSSAANGKRRQNEHHYHHHHHHPFLFARKFSSDSETVRRLMSMASEVILKD